MIGCSPGNDSSNSNQNATSYESTKKMVTDILKSEDGQKAIVDMIADDSTQKLYVIHDDTVKTAVEETLTADEGKDFWSRMFSDQEFVKSFSETIMEQQEDIFKRLMADSEYQKKMLELFGNPEFSKLVQAQLKSQQFKGHLEESIQETIESPLFQAQITEIIVKHAKEIAGGKEGEESPKPESGESGSGGSGGGDSADSESSD